MRTNQNVPDASEHTDHRILRPYNKIVACFSQELELKLEAQDQRITKEQQMEKKRFVKLQHEIEETSKECQDLTNRIKVAIVQTF